MDPRVVEDSRLVDSRLVDSRLVDSRLVDPDIEVELTDELDLERLVEELVESSKEDVGEDVGALKLADGDKVDEDSLLEDLLLLVVRLESEELDSLADAEAEEVIDARVPEDVGPLELADGDSRDEDSLLEDLLLLVDRLDSEELASLALADGGAEEVIEVGWLS